MFFLLFLLCVAVVVPVMWFENELVDGADVLCFSTFKVYESNVGNFQWMDGWR